MPNTEPKPLQVAVGVIENAQEHILITLRHAHLHQGGLWEFPGGKINPDETSEQCIIREISEELTISIEVLSQLLPIEFDYGKKQIRLIPFVCKIISGEINLTEHVAQKWIYVEEWPTIDWSGADHELILKNQESLKLLLL